MWKQLVELGNKVFALVRKTEQHDADIKELREDVKAIRQDIKEINQKIDRLAEALQRLTFEHQRDRENAETQREMQRLRLENILYRFERRLPPGNAQDETQE